MTVKYTSSVIVAAHPAGTGPAPPSPPANPPGANALRPLHPPHIGTLSLISALSPTSTPPPIFGLFCNSLHFNGLYKPYQRKPFRIKRMRNSEGEGVSPLITGRNGWSPSVLPVAVVYRNRAGRFSSRRNS